MNENDKPAAEGSQVTLVDMAATPEPKPVTHFNYTLVLAEVIYRTAGNNVGSRRCQIFSKADVATFPAARLSQIQNSAASQVSSEVNGKGFQALEVVILNLLPLGWMTDVEFWGSAANIPGREETPAPMAGELGDTDNVVPLQRP